MRARLEKAWSGLSRAEQLALGGTLIAAITGGGLFLSSRLSPKRASHAPQQAELRAMETDDLLRLYKNGDNTEKEAIARFCVCRVHDVREHLLEDEFEADAMALLSHMIKLKRLELQSQGTKSTKSLHEQVSFLEKACKSLKFDQEYIIRMLNMSLDTLRSSGMEGRAKENAERWGRAKKAVENKGISLAIFETKPTGGPEDSGYKKAAFALHREYMRLRWDQQKIQGPLADVTKRLDGRGYVDAYGHVATWDVRDVTDMKAAFAPELHRHLGEKETIGDFWGTRSEDAATSFGATGELEEEGQKAEPLDLSFWDTRNVETMKSMFEGYLGDVAVGMWDTRGVKDMSHMFADARNFNGDIGCWDTSNVESTNSMFLRATKFASDLRKWDLSSVEDYSDMFVDSAIAEGDKPRFHSLKDRAGMMVSDDHMVFGHPVPRSYV
jgi:hypothetical protein